MRQLGLALLSIVMAGCGSTQQSAVVARAAAPEPPPTPAAGVVFALNGAGSTQNLSDQLGQAVTESRAPIRVETFVWSVGNGRLIVDQTDHRNHIQQGQKLAQQICRFRQAYPGRRVNLVGHSAAGAVVLRAAEASPPDSIDRIILLSPSVCARYDLRPALRASRAGIDVYYSEADWLVLGLGMRVVGTTEGQCGTAAGQVGFTPVITTPADMALYRRLRQHPWDGSNRDGGHSGSIAANFLRTEIVPKLGRDP